MVDIGSFPDHASPSRSDLVTSAGLILVYYRIGFTECILQSLDWKVRLEQGYVDLMARSLPPDPSLASALLGMRTDRGMSQEAISHEAQITLGSYGRIERNEVAPSWFTVRAIARGLGVSMAELGEAVDAAEES